MMKIKAAFRAFSFFTFHSLLVAALAFTGFLPASAQSKENKGFPFITNYRYQDYNAGGVNWWAAEDDNGVMYFANGAGILIYDGQNWELVKPASGPEIRCLIKGKDGKIYVGTTGDIGYIAPAKNGKPEFISLKDKIPEKDRAFNEVWQVDEFKGNLYFQTTNKMFIWNYQSFKVLESKDGFHMSAVIGDKFYCRIWNRGLTLLKNDSFYVVPNGEKFASERIYAMLPYENDKVLIGSRTKGLFIYNGKDFTPFKTEADPFIVNTSLYGGLVLPDGNFALNTFNDGMIIIDKKGNLVQRIDKSVGLQDNSVDQLFLDSRGILWMPLFNGIAKFDFRSTLTFYNESSGLPAKTVFLTGYHNGYFYAGTNDGVYVLNKTTNRFQKVEGTGGQTGSFEKNGNDFLVGSAEKGLLKLVGTKSVPVIQGSNYDFHANLVIRSKIDSTVFYVSLRNGLAIVRYNPANHSYAVESIREGLRANFSTLIESKKNYLWLPGDETGELKKVTPANINGKLSLTEGTVKVYNHKQGLPAKDVAVGEYDGIIYFVSEKDSIFVYDDAKDRFIQDTSVFLKNYVDNDADGSAVAPIDPQGRIWANYGKGVFVKIPAKDGKLKVVDAPFKELRKNYPVWSITLTPGENGKEVAWFSGREGIIRYDGDLEETATGSFQTIIRGITLNEDSIYYSGFNLPSEKNAFSSKWNSVHIQYAAPFFKRESETQFSTFLEGRDKEWSEWSKQDFRDFGNLPPGKYTFRVKAKNIYDAVSPEASFTFSILPPWYATWWAWLLYALVAVALIYMIVRWRTRQLHEKHRELEKVVDERTGELKQRAEELAVINSVQEGLVKELNMDAIYEMVGERIRNVFDAQAVIIATLDTETGKETFKYAIEKGERFSLQPRPYDKLRQHLIKTREKILINADYEKAAAEFGMTVLPGTEHPKSLLFVPLILNEKVKSYVSLQNVDRENAFSNADVKLLETLGNSMSVALENARLFDETNRLLKETEQRTAELGVINSVQDGLAKELDIQGIYDLVGNKIRDLFDAQAVIIATFEQESAIEHFKYVIEDGQRFYLDARPYDKLRQHLIQSHEKVVIHNLAEAGNWFGKEGLSGTKPLQSGMFVPLTVGEKVTGYISLQNVDKENAFSDADVRLLETLSNSMSVALENARLFDETNRLLKETEQRTAELGVINSVQEGLVREMNMQAIYNLVGDRICNLFDTQTVIIRTFDSASNLEYWQYAIEKGERVYSDPRPIIWANNQLIKTRHSLLINENYTETAKKFGGTGVSKGLPPKSALFVPMIVGNEVKGSVSLQNVEKENAFTKSEERLLNTLTNSMSVALENARLFDESNRLLADAKQRANELSTVNSISQALTSQLNLDDLINLVGEQMKQLFNANIVYLAILDHKTNIINFPYQYGDSMEPLKLGEGLTSKIILTGEPLLINKDLQELRAQLGVKQIGVPAASYLGVPIPVGEEVIGVLSIQSTEHENRFNEDDMRLLTTIAASVGIALRKAKLFEEVQVAKLEAEAARKTAEKANDAKSAFLSTVSHELRTPLTSVLGFAKIIKKRLEDKIFPATDTSDPKTQKTITQISENLDVVVSEGQRLTHLINDVLDLAKIEAGKMEWNVETVAVPEIAERAIAATSSLFEHNDVSLEKNIKTDIRDISGDRDKLIQVMVNLISNAVKFTPKGKVTLSVYQQQDEIIVSVADTGIGIAPHDHAAVFEQFKQVGDTLTDKPKGTGLGLPICKEIVEHHDGRIWMESELGKGSTFYFALPVTKTTKAVSKPIHIEDLVRQLKEQVAQSQLNIKEKAARLLIVDDDDSIRSLLNQELSEGGYIIEEARNGKEALNCVRANRPDLIILDIMMPEMNGFDVAAVLKNDPQTMDIPIIVLSIVQDKTRGFRIGVDRYLTKPIDTGLLFNEIGSLLEQGKSKKKVMIVDEDSGTVNTLTEVLKTKGYTVLESDGTTLVEQAKANQPDIIIINSVLSGNQDIVKTLRFEKGLENVLFLVYQ